MPEAKKWPPGLRDRQSLSSDQSEDGSPLNTRGADSTRPPTDDSYAAVTWVAQGTHAARCSGNLQPAQNNGAREGMNPGSCRDLPGSEGNRSLGPRVADQGSLHFPGTSSSGKLKVRLCNHALWLPFSRQQNEMILTKQGRAMFPFLVYEIQGMDPSALYRVFVEVGSFDNYRWRYQCKKWLPCSQEEEDNVPGNRFYQHPDSPNTGAHWMHREVSFQKLKLTNKNTACNNGRQGPILLKSLHKYQPRLHIEEVSNGKQPTLTSSSRHTFTFPDTAFIAVTAYHNAEITRLKIQNNPFATAHRGGTSRPGQNLQNPPQAGEGTDFTSSPPSLVQEGPGQEKGCDLMHGSQPPSGHQYDSGDNRSTTSLSVPSNMEGLNPEPLPCTFPNAKSYHVSTDTPITQGNWPPSPSNCTCNENITGSLQSESPKPLQAGTGTEEEERVQEQCCQSISRHPSDVSHLGQRTSKKRCLSPVDSAQDSLASGSKTREQEDMCLVACKCGGNSSQEASCYPVVLQEYLGQAKEKMNPTPGNSIQEIQPPSELPSDSTDLDLNSVLRQLFPSISPTAILYEASPDTPIRKGNWPNSPSNCTSNVNSLECLQSESPKPQQAGTGTEEEERVQEHLCQSISRHPSDVSHLGQRTPKKRCLSPADSAKDSLASGLKTREQEDMCPVASECDGNSSQETVSEPSGYPVVLQEDPDQNKEQMNWTPGNSFQESQPPSEHFSDLTDLDPNCVLCEFFPSIAPSAMLYEASPGTPITQGIGPHSPANCTSTVNSMECLQFAPQQAGTGAEEEERLQEQLCPSNSWSPSNVSQMGQRTSKKRYLSPVDPAKNFSGPAWKAREQEVKCPVARESSGNSSQEAVPEPSCYPVVLQEDPGQNKEKMSSTPCDLIEVTQPHSDIAFHSNHRDLLTVSHQLFPSTSPPAMPYELSPENTITERNWPPSLSNCTPSVNTPYSDKDPLASRWTIREQVDKCLRTSEPNDFSTEEAISEDSCYPAVVQDDIGRAQEEIIPNPCYSIHETQPPLEFSCQANALDLGALIHQVFTSPSLPTMPYDPSADIPINQGNWTPFPSNCTLNVNRMECFPSVNPKPQQVGTVTEEEERLQYLLGPSSSRSPSDVSHLRQRTSKKRCLSPINSDKDSLASGETTREQVDKCLIASQSNDFGTQQAISEGSCYPAVVQDDIGRAQEEIIPNPCYSIHETQPPLEFSCQANALDLGALIHQVFTSPSLPTMPYDPSADIPINQGNWTLFPSNCTSNVNSMECFLSVNPKPQQVGTAPEEEERFQVLLGPSSSRSPSDVSHLRQRTSKKRCFSPADSSKDFSASAWKALEQEVKCPVDKESSGISSQEAVSEASCYPVLLQEDPGQSKVKTNPTPCDLIQETQSHSHLAFHSNHRDLLTVSHQLFPSTCPPAIPYEPSPDNTITERNWPPSHSNCTSSVNIPYSDKDSLASRWTTREQVDKCLRASESNDFSTQETISEGSCYPAGWQDYIGQAQEEIIPNPSDPIQVTQPPSELPFHFNALDLDALIHQVFSSTSPPTVPYEPSADFPITQGNWPHSLSNCTSNVNSMECFLSVNPKPQQGGTVTEDEESLQDQLGPSSFRSPSNVSQMGQRTSEKRFLSQVDSAKDFSGPAWKAREQEVKHPVASKSSGHSSQEAASEASCYPVILQEDPGQTKEKMNPTPWDSIPCTRPPSQLPFHCNGLAQVPVIDRFFPFIFPPTMPYEPSPATHITQGNWPCSLSNCTSNVNSMECFQPDSPKPQQGGTVTTEEERLQDQVCPSSSRSPSDVSHLGQRTSKKRCLSPVNSVMDSLASACTTREQEEKCLVACENSGNSSQKAVSEASSYPVVLQEDIGRAKEKKNPTPLDSILETQPTSGLSFDPNLYAGIHQYFPSSSPPASPHEPSPNTPITQGNWPYSFSNCTSKVTSMECFWPGSQKPQQGSTGTGEEERLQEPLCPSSFRSPSDVSHLGQRPSKRRCLSPVDSAKDFSASAWEAREEEVKCPVASESSGNSSQEAVSEASCYPVVLREENGQAKEKNATPWDYILETQPPSELTFGSALSDVTHQFFPSTSPAMPYPTSPEQPITQGSCPPSLSTGTSNGNHVDSFHSGNQILREQALGPRKKKDFRSNSTHPAPGPLQMSPTCGKEVPRRDAYLQ